jgi:prephenate dehydratase
MIFLTGFFKKSNQNDNVLITVTGQPGNDDGMLDKIVTVLKQHCEEVNLTRMDENDSLMEAAFWVEFQNYQSLSKAKSALKEIDPKFAISLLDQKGLN